MTTDGAPNSPRGPRPRSGDLPFEATRHFDRLHEAGWLAVGAGRAITDTVPADGGRWGMAIVLRPTGAAARRMGELAEEAAVVAGPEQWPTGADTVGHVTVRALEPFRDQSRRDWKRETRFAELLSLAAAEAGPVRLAFAGLSLSPATVFVRAHSPDGSAEVLRRAIADAFTDDLEATGFVRDPVWYLTLVHFTAQPADHERLISWVEARRNLELGEVLLERVELCRYDFDGRVMRPGTIAAIGLGKARGQR
ncbi:MAG TPA: hypothetical protein VNF24_10890 [Candidatus Acidoferrales bacterium]|nr:hypothetical protein [Candidatus Acidoferrales bacterium]